MADHHKEEEKEEEVEKKGGESLLEKVAHKIHGDDSSSSSDSDDGKASSIKAKVFRLFRRKKSVHSLLGGGKPADVLLWRDKKVSGGVLAVATTIWFLFEVMEYHLLTIVTHGLILGLAFVFLWSNANTIVKKSPKIPIVHIPEDPVLKVVSMLRIQINHAFVVLRDIVTRRDVKKFLSVIAGLWVISVIGSWCDFLTLLYIITLLLLSMPLLYEKYECQVDSFVEKATAELKKQYEEFDAKVLSKIPKGSLKDKKRD